MERSEFFAAAEYPSSVGKNLWVAWSNSSFKQLLSIFLVKTCSACRWLLAAGALSSGVTSSTNLLMVEESAQRILAVLKGCTQDQLASNVFPTFQLVLDLMSSFDDWVDATLLIGEAMDEDEYL